MTSQAIRAVNQRESQIYQLFFELESFLRLLVIKHFKIKSFEEVIVKPENRVYYELK